MKNITRQEALQLLVLHPQQAAVLCGYPLIGTPMHGAWLRQMISGTGDMTLMAHRGSYKTTCVSMAIAILMCIHPQRNLMFLRKTDDDAAQVIRQVKRIIAAPVMETLTAAIWGEPFRAAKSTAWELTLSGYSAPRGAVQLLGCGIGGSLTGKHADMLFTDDIVNIRDRISSQQRERTRLMYMELQNIRNPGGRIINTGTPWHPQDAFALMPPADRWDWRRTGLLTHDQAETLRRRMTPSLFAANYDLQHIARTGALFRDPPQMFDDPSLLLNGIAHIDAAYGGGDGTALTLACRHGDSLYLLGQLYPGHVQDHLPDILSLCRRYRCEPLWCETNADKGYLARSIRALGASVRLYRENTNKYLKISTHLRAAWPNLYFHRATDPDYLNQILDYSLSSSHDDAPDSAACACRLLRK